MPRSCFCALGLALACCLSAGASRAEYVIQNVMMPGTTFTSAWGINDRGQFVGSAFDGTSQYGYIYDAGTVTRLMPFDSWSNVTAFGISSTGIVAAGLTRYDAATGQSYNAPAIYQEGVATVLDLGLGSANVYARGISPDARYVTGYYQLADRSNGFVYDRTTASVVAVIDSGPGGFLIAQGVNSHGQVVGRRTGANSGAFIYDIASGSLSSFGFSGYSVSARGINDQGQIAGWMIDSTSFVGYAWIGNSSGYQIISGSAEPLLGQGLNNLGQVVGYRQDNQGLGFLASPSVLPSGGGAGAPYTFNTSVVADVPVFIDPLVAIGYGYAIGAGNPRFKTVSLPPALGDDLYTLSVEGQVFTLSGSEIFDFTAHGFADGVAAFRVEGIEPELQLDPADGTAFVTRVSFMANGQFTGTMTPITMDYTAPVPELPSALLLGCGGLLLAAARRRPLGSDQAISGRAAISP